MKPNEDSTDRPERGFERDQYRMGKLWRKFLWTSYCAHCHNRWNLCNYERIRSTSLLAIGALWRAR